MFLYLREWPEAAAAAKAEATVIIVEKTRNFLNPGNFHIMNKHIVITVFKIIITTTNNKNWDTQVHLKESKLGNKSKDFPAR